MALFGRKAAKAPPAANPRARRADGQSFNERENFRVPVVFDSFAYPAGGGRARIRSVDLSCGGMAFLAVYPFVKGDRFQTVIPVTVEGPLLIYAQILRIHPGTTGVNKYACRFLGLIDDEEAALRQAVFAVQVRDRPRQRA